VSVRLQSDEIKFYQNLILKVPVTDNVLQYAVNLTGKSRPGTAKAHAWANSYLTWGAGPRASQYLILGAKCHAAVKGKFSPDADDVKAVATAVLRHRLVRNYKAEAEGISVEAIIKKLMEA
jgi:MoxR-like ATPase